MTRRVTRVVKVGGRAQGDPALPAAIAAAALDGVAVCVVHGGGDEVSDLQRRLGMEPRFIGGRRVTSETDFEIVRMVLSGSANKRMVAQLVSAGLRAVGVSGEDDGLLKARITDPAMGRVGGQITVNGALVRDLLESGYTPVVSPVARDGNDSNGAGLNVNGDDAAAALAAAIGADDLVFVADVPGVLDDGNVISMLDSTAATTLIERGVATAGMAAKLQAATDAVRLGVPTVRIVGVSGIGNSTAGTRILAPAPTTLSHTR